MTGTHSGRRRRGRPTREFGCRGPRRDSGVRLRSRARCSERSRSRRRLAARPIARNRRRTSSRFRRGGSPDCRSCRRASRVRPSSERRYRRAGVRSTRPVSCVRVGSGMPRVSPSRPAGEYRPEPGVFDGLARHGRSDELGLVPKLRGERYVVADRTSCELVVSGDGIDSGVCPRVSRTIPSSLMMNGSNEALSAPMARGRSAATAGRGVRSPSKGTSRYRLSR